MSEPSLHFQILTPSQRLAAAHTERQRKLRGAARPDTPISNKSPAAPSAPMTDPPREEFFSPANPAMKFDSRSILPELTRRQRQIAAMTFRGDGNKEIGRTLRISARTAEYHRSKVFERLKVRDAIELVHIIYARAMVTP